MNLRPKKTLRLVAMGVLALAATVLAGGIWTALFLVNLRVSPRVPWCVAVMGAILWLAWSYMGGKGRPQTTSNFRREHLRARRVSPATFWWSQLAGGLAIIALAGLWIVLFQLVPMHPNVFLPDFSKYPALTMTLGVIMGSLVSPLMEEGFFRGYFQVALEREFRAPLAITISSFVFMLAHLNHGLLWPKLLVYFLVGLTFGTIARLSNSVLPAIPVHIFGDVLFFTLVWPHDAARQLIWHNAADAWFWLHALQTVLFAGLSLLAFFKLRRITKYGQVSAQPIQVSQQIRRPTPR
jgi:membrane protease YdiL (CAAX protease family)